MRITLEIQTISSLITNIRYPNLSTYSKLQELVTFYLEIFFFPIPFQLCCLDFHPLNTQSLRLSLVYRIISSLVC